MPLDPSNPNQRRLSLFDTGAEAIEDAGWLNLLDAGVISEGRAANDKH